MAELDYRGDIPGSISTLGRMKGSPEYTNELAGLMGASMLGPISPMLAPLLNPIIGNGIGGAVATMASMPDSAEGGIFSTIGKGLSKAKLRGRGASWINALGDEIFEIPTSNMVNAVKNNGRMNNLKGYLDMDKIPTDELGRYMSGLDDRAIGQVNRAIDTANTTSPQGISPFGFIKEGGNPITTRGFNSDEGSIINNWLSRAQKIDTGIHETQHAVQRGDLLNSSAGEYWSSKLPYKYRDELREIEARQAGRRSRYPKELTSSNSEYGIHPEIRFNGNRFTPDRDVVPRHINNKYLANDEATGRWKILQDEANRLNNMYKTDEKFKGIVDNAHNTSLSDKIDYNTMAAYAATVPASYMGSKLINSTVDSYYDSKRRDEAIRTMIHDKMNTPSLSDQLATYTNKIEGYTNE